MSSLYKSPASRWKVLDDNTIVPRPQYDSTVVPYITTATMSLSTGYVVTESEPVGSFYWDAENNTVSTVLENGVILQQGQELLKWCKNVSGTTIANGIAVSIKGTNGSFTPVAPTDVHNPESAKAFYGLATQDFGINEFGYVAIAGIVRGIDTSSFEENDVLYVSCSAGGELTTEMPTPSCYVCKVGVVEYKHINQGRINVIPLTYPKIEDMSGVDGTPLSADGQIITWHENSQYFDFDKNINDYVPRELLEATEDPTGFIDPEDVIITGDSANRQVTLTGTIEAYWQGTRVETLSSGWVSPQHGTDTSVRYFLLYDGTDFEWVASAALPSDFYKNLLICWSFHNSSSWVYQRECHSIMQHQTHREFHQVVGTYRASGGLLGDYVLESTTAANRRPTIEETLIYDEDLPTTNPALPSGLYTRFWLSGANGDGTFGVDSTDIVALNGNQPYFNQFTGGTWTQTLMSNNNFMSVWVVAIPVAADAESQKHRYVFLQGQSQSGTLSDQQALSPSDLTLALPALTPESVFIAKIIIRFQSSNWHIAAVQNITGTRASQATSPAGNYLSLVATDTTIDGNGTVANPLTINPNISGTSLSLTDVTFTGAVSTLETATLSAAEYIIVEVGGIEKAIQLWDF
jgi:hypothetical protein